MIVVKLMGGLGNQMFQYALGRSLALKNNTILKLDVSFFHDKTSKDKLTSRDYELDIFKIKAEIADLEDILQFNLSKYSIIDYLKYKFGMNYIVNEKWLSGVKETLVVPDNSYLEGYWQSEKYFQDIEDIIRKDFIFKREPNGQNLDLFNEIKSKESISIHVRRGDYVENKHTNKVHGTCSLEYYQKAVNLISQKTADPYFYIFSDDPEWVKNNLSFEYPMKFVTHNVGDKNYEDLRLMSVCKHNIIANSSFSWWGAWLNDNPDKIVIAPKKWFNNSSVKNDELIPEKWIQI